MAEKGNCYVITLRKTHMEWGEYRHTSSRETIIGEAYIPIPLHVAQEFELFNSKGTGGVDILGKNLFKFSTVDNYINGILKAQGNKRAGDIYAKQFSVYKDLRALGEWFQYIGATEGTMVKVEWISSDEVVLSKVR